MKNIIYFLKDVYWVPEKHTGFFYKHITAFVWGFFEIGEADWNHPHDVV